jgi:hypothetical protein
MICGSETALFSVGASHEFDLRTRKRRRYLKLSGIAALVNGSD